MINFNDNKTFILVLVGMAIGCVFAIMQIPMPDWMLTIIIGGNATYAAKSIGGKFATKKNGEEKQ